METTPDNSNSSWIEDNSGDNNAGNAQRQAPALTRIDDKPIQPPSQLFTVRIWSESTGQGVMNWRGKVQAVPNGAWRYFQDWQVLSAFLQNEVEAHAALPQEHYGTQPDP